MAYAYERELLLEIASIAKSALAREESGKVDISNGTKKALAKIVAVADDQREVIYYRDRV